MFTMPLETKILIDRGANIDQPDRWGTTPLYAASSSGHASVVSILVDNGAKVNQEDNGGRTPFYAATNNRHDVVVAVFES
jgi:ankyrin repeat protein